MRMGRQPKISKTQHRSIFRAALTGDRTARKMRERYNCDVTLCCVLQLLRIALEMKYKKILSGPSLKPTHIEARLKWARDFGIWCTRWRRVVFSDEKKFNLDRSDGFKYYGQDLLKEAQYFSKLQQGGAGVMIWAPTS